jgi:hypothetical protein
MPPLSERVHWAIVSRSNRSLHRRPGRGESRKQSQGFCRFFFLSGPKLAQGEPGLVSPCTRIPLASGSRSPAARQESSSRTFPFTAPAPLAQHATAEIAFPSIARIHEKRCLILWFRSMTS